MQVPKAPSADYRIYATEASTFRELVERMRGDLEHVPADDIMFVNHAGHRCYWFMPGNTAWW